MLTFHHVGEWGERQVRAQWTDQSSRPAIPEVEVWIEDCWAEATASPGTLLFDGPMCRMESSRVTADGLELVLSPTSYKSFLGTNLTRPQWADQYGPAVLANPVGVSPALETADGYLMLGRRNAAVAYYPDRVHPFAGAMEPRDAADVFSCLRRELAEELALSAAGLADVRCVALVEDQELRQPELIFRVRTRATSRQLKESLERAEHGGTYQVPATAEGLRRAIADPRLTPVAVASLILWGRAAVGDEWFRQQVACASRRVPGRR